MKRGLRRNIPSSDSPVIFEAAARHLSFTRAGEELGLTQGAISRQILDLEAFSRHRCSTVHGAPWP